MRVRVKRVDWEFATPFRTAQRIRTHAQTIVVELRDGQWVGRGEAQGISYRGETVDTLLEQVGAVAPDLRNGMSRTELQMRLPPGGARNAIDCAMWDLEAKRTRRRAWEIAGLESVWPIITSYTLGIDTPQRMARAAGNARQYSLLKIKLIGNADLERVTLIRQERPDADLIVDANQSWSEERLCELAPRLAELGVLLIEQPLAVGNDAILERFSSPVPLCADESCHTVESLAEVSGKYQFVNIKLDKTGGFTEALRLAAAAKTRGLRLMVGCMAGSSLSMAPAFVVGQLCELADLDGPLLAKGDVANAIRYQGSRMLVPEPELWG